MRTQIWIIAGSFVVFGLIALIFTGFSLAYIGLMLFGLAGFLLGFIGTK